MKGNPWTISNVLSASRILLMAPVVYFFLSPMEHNREYAVLFTLLAVTTDALDGYFARLFHQESELGKVIDPLADKIGVGIVVVLLLIFGDIPLWFALLVLCRDIIIFFGGLYIRKRTGMILPSSPMITIRKRPNSYWPRQDIPTGLISSLIPPPDDT